MTGGTHDGATVPVTVVVPTVGRVALLEACLRSIIRCDPAPAEVIVVDQSGGDDVARLVTELGPPVRHVPQEGRGIARAVNAGFRAAANEVVMRTDDDCTVAPDWVGVSAERMAERPDGMLTGQVRAGGDPAGTPSTITDPEPKDHTGAEPAWVLYSGNMAVNRERALELGGFDEQQGLLVAAEDNDFCYRWMDAGLPLRYEPAMVVWHHDWRTPAELRRRYGAYARGQGAFYAKHLAGGDRRFLRHVRDDVRAGLRANLQALRRPSTFRTPDEARALLVGIPVGMVSGWRGARRAARRAAD